MTAAVGFGLAIGLLLGLVGGGGSILAVPALVYGLGLPLASAVPTSLLVVGVSSAVAVLPRVARREVAWRLAAVFCGAGIPMAFVGAAVNRLLPPRLLLGALVGVMLAAAWRMLHDDQPSGDCAASDARVARRSRLPTAVATGAGVGLLTGLLGVGGGFVVVPALVLLLRVPLRVAVGTSLVVVSANSVAGLTAHLRALPADSALTTGFALATVTGSLLADRLGARLPSQWLRRGFAWLVAAVAVFVAVAAVRYPGAAG